MTHYYLDLHDGEIIPDEEGLKLRDLEVVQREAARALAGFAWDRVANFKGAQIQQLTIAVREIATGRQGRQVGTVGRIAVEPNSPNVIPGRVTMSVEFRDTSDATPASCAGGRYFEVHRPNSELVGNFRNHPRWLPVPKRHSACRTVESADFASRHAIFAACR